MAKSVDCICTPVNSGKKKDCKKCHPDCICNPKNSGLRADCKHCHPRTWMLAARTGHDPRHRAEEKAHSAVKTGNLPWLQVPIEVDQAQPYDPYEHYVDTPEE